jgi:hypothetical protein
LGHACSISTLLLYCCSLHTGNSTRYRVLVGKDDTAGEYFTVEILMRPMAYGLIKGGQASDSGLRPKPACRRNLQDSPTSLRFLSRNAWVIRSNISPRMLVAAVVQAWHGNNQARHQVTCSIPLNTYAALECHVLHMTPALAACNTSIPWLHTAHSALRCTWYTHILCNGALAACPLCRQARL